MLPDAFEQESVKLARKLALQDWEPAPWRRDLTQLLCFTIDDEDARDLDDAISCYPTLEGGWELCIHIADPDAFVCIHSPLDHMARERGTSIYLPTQHIPMFPHALSEGAMSLERGEERPAMTAKCTFDPDLELASCEFFFSTIKVQRRLSYNEVDTMLKQQPSTALGVALAEASYLANELFHARLFEGAVDMHIPKAKIKVQGSSTKCKETKFIVYDEHSPARALISELMILAGAQVANFCAAQHIPILYKCQTQPLDAHRTRNIHAQEDTRHDLVRAFQQRSRMTRAYISTSPMPHFGLGLSMYAQATSPIRRYSDLVTQRQLKAHLNAQPLPYNRHDLDDLARTLEHSMNEAKVLERGAHTYWLLHHLSTHLDTSYTATVLEPWSASDHSAPVFIDQLATQAHCIMKTPHNPGAQIQVHVRTVNPEQETFVLEES